MVRRGPSSLVFAALLLVVQLLGGVMSAWATGHDGAQHCAGCPGGESSGLVHHSPSGADHCGSHCSHGGSPGHGHTSCRTGCAMFRSGHCGSSTPPLLATDSAFSPLPSSNSLRADLRRVHLPDSPLFDLLRPPTRG